MGASVLTRWMGTMLFGVDPTDAGTFAAISILLAVVALAASYLPSRRAMALEPGGRAAARIGKLMITLRNVEKFYEGGYGRSYVLRRVNVEIKEGEFVTIMGPSGAGKSTLLSILGMLDGAWTGEFEFLGNMVHRMKPKDRVELNKKYIGFVFQSYHLIDNLTVYENLDIPLSYRNVKGSERAAMVCDTLDRFHIVGKRDLYPSQLSGGQQQLVAVARAVIANPKLILADEPTGNLHSSQGKEIMELFKKLNDEGTTIVQVTHSVDNAAYGNRVIQLADGWVVSGGSDAGRARVAASGVRHAGCGPPALQWPFDHAGTPGGAAQVYLSRTPAGDGRQYCAAGRVRNQGKGFAPDHPSRLERSRARQAPYCSSMRPTRPTSAGSPAASFTSTGATATSCRRR